MRSSSLKYMPALDGMRAVAVLMVFVQHAFPWFGFPGGLGVDVFFVISGFLITRILLKQHAKTGRIRLGQFYLKRMLRLYPALLVMVLTFLALWQVMKLRFTDMLAWSGWALTYLSNIAMSHLHVFLLPFRQTWSLAMEEQYYLVWPLVLIFMLSARWSHRTIVIALVIAAAASYTVLLMMPGLGYSPLTRAGALLIGSATATLVHEHPWQSTRLGYGALAVLIAVMTWTMYAHLPYAVATIATGVLMPFLILHCAFRSSLIVRVLSQKWLVYLGVISYAVYLWHYPILYALRASTHLTGSLTGLLAFVLTLVAAVLSEKLVEGPFNRLKNRVGVKTTAAEPA